MTRNDPMSKFNKLYPLSSTLIGTLFVYFASAPSIMPLVGLIIYISTQVWLKQKGLPYKSDKATAGVTICNIGLLLYFSFMYSFFVLPIFLVLTFFIQTEKIFYSLKLQQLYIFLYSYISLIIFNLLSFYFQARYLTIPVTLNISLMITAGFILSAIYKYTLKTNSEA